ncbi:arylesterase [Opitutus sp. ER46]|uniref:arylesterase n=1 Tax=Opitutus sp. ER46 TaxID=2161864 RepID=UPI001E642F60|nr:arylesterase [Opitutus sp. ER46]
MSTIIFFGDSLTAGYGLDNPGVEAYPALVQQKLDESGVRWRAVNAGLSGETSAGGLRRVDWILRQPCQVFVLALGANDGLRGVDPAVTQANLTQILQRVRARNPTARVIVAGMEMPPGMGQAYIDRYRAIFPAVARDADAVLLPFLLEGVAGHPDLNQADGIHPTAAGHRLVAETVWKTLRPLL